MDPDVLYQQALKGDIAAAKQLWSLAQQGNPIASMAFGLLPDDIQRQAKGEAATTPFQAITGPDGAIYAFNRATGIMGKEAIIPAAKVKGTEKWEIKTDPATGRLFIIDLADMFPADTKRFITAPASPASALTAKDIKIVETIVLPDDSKDVYTRVGAEVVKTHVPADKKPFPLGEVIEKGGVNYLEVAEGIFRELPVRYQADVIELGKDKRQFIRQPDGSLKELGRKETEAGVEIVGGREFIRDTSGNLQPLAPAPLPAGVTVSGGREFLQQPSGALQELSPRTPNMVMDQIISEAIVAGDLDKALAYQDFRDRPTEQDALSYAMQFARSPADQNVISALARGELTVEQRPSTPTRVGPQPDFLISAFNKFQQSLTAGRAPTGPESKFYLGLPQQREQAKLAAQKTADEAKAQRDLEATTQAGLKTAAMFQEFMDKFGSAFAGLVGAPAGGGTPAGGGAPPSASSWDRPDVLAGMGGVPTGGAPFGTTPGGAGGPGMIAGQQFDPSTVVPTGGANAPALKGYAAGTTFADIERR